jgi:hypothetical protein
MVGLDTLDGHRQATPHFLDELGGRFDGVVSIDSEHPIPGGLIDGRELIEAAGAEFEVFDIDLDRLTRYGDLSPASGAWAIAFQGYARDATLLQDPMDRGSGDINVVIPLQEEADPKGPVLTLAADLQDQGDNVFGSRKGMMARPSRPVAKTNQTVLAVAVTPGVEEGP